MSILDIAQTVKAAQDSHSGGKDFAPPREGVALFRMSSVIEMGIVKSEWKGVEKENKKLIVEFELLHPDHAIKNDQGEVVKYHTCLVYLNKSGFDKSKYMRLFNKLNYDGAIHVEKNTIPSIARFLGKGFLGQIHHKKTIDGKKTYVNVNQGDDYTIGAPRVPVQDEMGVPTGKYKGVPVPAMTAPARLFLWEADGITDEQYREMWASIHMDGKNYFQTAISSPDNIAWEGSRAQMLFGEGSQIKYDDDEVEEETSPFSESKPAQDFVSNDTEFEAVEEVAPEPPKKAKRKRRSKAEMAAFRAEQERKKNGAALNPPESGIDDAVDPLEMLGL